MIAVISPAKTLDFESPVKNKLHTMPEFLQEAEIINSVLRKMGVPELMRQMSLSARLANLNAERNQAWSVPFTPDNAKQAVFMFNGDVYEGLDAASLSERELDFAQQKVRILSGLYGLLKPLDLIRPYRLEMGIRLKIEDNKDLYHFWRDKVTDRLNQELSADDGVLINLASNEYFKAIDEKRLNGRIVNLEFRDFKNGQYKIIAFYAKKARGLMTRFMVENGLTNPEDLKAFDLEGYYFNSRLSNDTNWVFTRDK